MPGSRDVARACCTSFWYDFYFKKPEANELEKKLQAFADSKFKGLRTWKAVHGALRAAGVRSLPPAAAAAASAPRPGLLAAFGAPAAVILDVREPAVFAGGHAAGARNVPLYTQMVRQPRVRGGSVIVAGAPRCCGC